MAILYNYNKNGWPTCARAREDLSRRGVARTASSNRRRWTARRSAA